MINNKEFVFLTVIYIIFAILILFALYLLIFRTGRKKSGASGVFTQMRFSQKGRFRILQLTDLHLIFPFGKNKKNTFDMIRRLVKKEQPKLVVVSGDLCLSPVNSAIYDAFSKLMDELNQKWAIVFGNHDCHLGFSKAKLAKRLSKYKNCMNPVSCTDTHGYTDFIITLSDITERDEFALCFLDSGSYSKASGKLDYDRIHPEQSDWYKDKLEQLGNIPNIVFCHFPLPEVTQLAMLRDFKGTMGTEPGFSKLDTNFFNVASSSNAKGIFFGHDHKNDFCGSVANTILAYGRISGFGVYKAGNLKPGARVIDVLNGGSQIVTRISD